MSIPRILNLLSHRLSRAAAVTTLVLGIASCGSGGEGIPGSTLMPPSTAMTGTLGVLLTDGPTHEFGEINIGITDVILIGGDDGQQSLFSGERMINLLDLANYNEPLAFDEVAIGSYNKLRLHINFLELVFPPEDGRAPVRPPLPANGKIDLLDQDGFEILPGRTLLAEIDIDANKSIKVTETGGGSGSYRFRPVVKVKFMTAGELPDKLTRLAGTVNTFGNADGEFELCSIVRPDNCIDVFSGEGTTSFFGPEGTPAMFTDLDVGETVVVIGRYREEGEEDDDGESGVDIDLELDAVVVQIGGNSSHTSGNVVSEPDADGRFLLVSPGDEVSMTEPSPLAVRLQEGTRVFDTNVEVDATAIITGSEVEVEGVFEPLLNLSNSELLAAIVFVAPEARDQLSGEVSNKVDNAGTRVFDLTTAADTLCVELATDAAIIEVNTSTSEVTTGASFDVVVDGKSVDAFGAFADPAVPGDCFKADEIIVETSGT